MNEFQVYQDSFPAIVIDDIRAQKRRMEDKIKEATVQAVKEFKEKAGLSPSCIGISMVSVEDSDQRRREYFVGDVFTDVPVW